MTKVPREVVAALAVAADPPPLGDWPARGANPARRLRAAVKEAGWPHRVAPARLPQVTYEGRGTAAAVQPVLLVPETWLAELARLLGVDYADACRGTVG